GNSGASTYNSGTGALNIPVYQALITLTTTNTSGAATFNSTTGALNIPNYSVATPAFSAITAGTNTTALLIGTGGSLGTSGSGTITATSMAWSGLTGGTPTWNQNTTGTSAGLSATSTQNQVYATPNGASGAGSFRALVVADIPTGLNQNTTGTSAGISGSQTANFVYAAPNGSAGTATFRALVPADIPTLNQSTTGTAGGLSGTPTISVAGFSASGTVTFSSITGTQCLHSVSGVLSGTGSDCGSGSGGVTTVSIGNLSPLFTAAVGTPTTTPAIAFTLSSAAQNSVFAGPPTGGAGAPSYQTAPTFSAANLTSFPTFNQSTTGTSAGISGSQTANFFLAAPNGSAGTAAFRAIVAADIPTLNQSTTGNAATATSATTATNTAGGVLGSLAYQTGAGATSFLAPNTAASLKFLTQTGTGSVGAAPVWTTTLPIANGGTNAATAAAALASLMGGPASGTYSIICSSSTSCTPTAVSGGSAFSAITSGTNTTAAMVVGTGGSLGVSGTGTINATTLL
ncbi:MAG TPA: hypothetical protein VGF75_03870, partial [Candidatus Saccharimonadales bacterium]